MNLGFVIYCTDEGTVTFMNFSKILWQATHLVLAQSATKNTKLPYQCKSIAYKMDDISWILEPVAWSRSTWHLRWNLCRVYRSVALLGVKPIVTISIPFSNQKSDNLFQSAYCPQMFLPPEMWPTRLWSQLGNVRSVRCRLRQLRQTNTKI